MPEKSFATSQWSQREANVSVKTLCLSQYAVSKRLQESLAYRREDYPDDHQRRFATEPFGSILEKLRGQKGNSKTKPTYHLTDRLAGRLDSSPSRDVFSRDDGCSGAGELLNEALVGDDPTVEIDFLTSC